MPLLAVAASGGADSTALIAMAARHFAPKGVVVLSVDHGTRISAAAERAHVWHLAERFGFSFHELQIGPVPANQAAWRQARLGALVGYCRDRKIGRLWLGQHRDDAIETAALRLLAGGRLPSLAGISAIRTVQGVAIERPLLNYSARAVRRSLITAGLAWYEDPSNRQEHYRRVAIRRLLAGGSEGQEAADLVRRTGEWRAARESLIAAAWAEAVSFGSRGRLWLCPAAMRALPQDLSAVILHRAALEAVGREQRLRNVDFAAVACRDLASAPLGGARVWDVDGRWLVGRDYRHIQERLALSPGRTVRWDARYDVCLSTVLREGGLQAGRLGLRAARRLSGDLPPAWAAAALAIWCGKELVAVPDFAVWQGSLGSELAENLLWRHLPPRDNGLFRVAPRRGAPILRL